MGKRQRLEKMDNKSKKGETMTQKKTN